MAIETDPELARPIIVLGAPRSGTTFFGTLLSKHPRVAYVSEPRLVWRWGNDAKSDLLGVEDARPEVVRHVRSTLAGHVRRARKERLVEKHPSNCLRLPFVNHILPDAKFLHLIRNGLESSLGIAAYWRSAAGGVEAGKLLERLKEADLRQAPHYAKELMARVLPNISGVRWTRLWGPRIPGLAALARELDVLDVAALQWRMCVEQACHYGRQLPPDRYVEHRLEDMTADSLARILDFLELDDARGELKAAFRETFSQDEVRSRVRKAKPEDIARVRLWVEPTLHWLGYE